MNEFIKKRDNLESFVKEQIIGPGAYNKRYHFLKDWENSEYREKLIKDTSALSNSAEIIPEVPAYQYSSAILFPETLVDSSNGQMQVKSTDIPDDEDQKTNESADDEEFKDTSNDSLISKQQNYPNQFGLSFVIGRDSDLQKDLLISLKFRKYKHHKPSNVKENQIACWIPEYEMEIKEVVAKYFNPYLKVDTLDDNYFIAVDKKPEKQEIYDIDYILLNQYIKENLLIELKNSVPQITLIKEDTKSNTQYFGTLEPYETTLYSIKNEKSYQEKTYVNVISIYENEIIELIKRKLSIDIKEHNNYNDLIKQLEITNQLRYFLNDLKSFYKDNPTPIWQSTSYERKIKLPSINESDGIFRSQPESIDHSNEELKDLKYMVQYVINDKLVYIKLLVINKFTITLGNNEVPQLNKKDKANEKSFFGVELTIEELQTDVLKRYNPINLIDFDEEDNFSKLLYRKYIDYGEGYNTSVNWFDNKGLKTISTDFLPSQQTPNVDFEPSRIENDKVEKRLKDDNVLSMRELSILNINEIDKVDEVNNSNKKLLKRLDEFIHQYHEWITEKNTELDGDKTLTTDEAHLLRKQLKACSIDHERLVRNLKLLEHDKKAISAFRLMNTAMFMQLHHSLAIKKKKQVSNASYFNEFSNNVEYYKNVECIKFDDYKWRSFQLAFILLNIDGFVRPFKENSPVSNVFGTDWPERNEIADLVWFPTGGGKTEAYLGLIAFAIAYRRFTKGEKGNGTTVLMRYTLRLLTLQQFQRATILICALESIRSGRFRLPFDLDLGKEKITIGLFVGEGSLPNKWDGNDKSMKAELNKISQFIKSNNTQAIPTNIPFTECPWCGHGLFINSNLDNVYPNHRKNTSYRINDELSICCNNECCTFYEPLYPGPEKSIPFRLFDDDIYKFPPTLLFGTVDKFAALANNVHTTSQERNRDSRRLVGKGYDFNLKQNRNVIPPELIIQDELHLLLGPLGTAVGLYEKSIDSLCSYIDEEGNKIQPKIITSTATTRNTDKQIFALFNRRAEIFPKQGINFDDSFFSFNKRDKDDINKYVSNRKYIGILPIGKTQVWMQLRVASIALAHRIKYLKEKFNPNDLYSNPNAIKEFEGVFDYYHTILSYFNSLKDVGKTQSQLSHYLPGDLNYIIKNTTPWSFWDKMIRKENEINYSELTGRLTGEEVKTNLSEIERKWSLFSTEPSKSYLTQQIPPEFIISTNMISVGIDVSRFNTMIISSMPRNIAEYIQASSRVARDKEGVVFTVHHPFRSRDISHYQKFKEFHEKFYSYVEPISVTPFASKALDRYLAMLIAVMVRHDSSLDLTNNDDAAHFNNDKKEKIIKSVMDEISSIKNNAEKLNDFLIDRDFGMISSVEGIIGDEELNDLENKTEKLLENWKSLLDGTNPLHDLKFREYNNIKNSLYISISDPNNPNHWKVAHSLREIAPSCIIKTVQQ